MFLLWKILRWKNYIAVFMVSIENIYTFSKKYYSFLLPVVKIFKEE